MEVQEFISKYRNHPVLFVGTGMSLRYLKNSYTWDGLLEKISTDLTSNREDYYDIKSSTSKDGKFNFLKIAEVLEKKFNDTLTSDRNGKFKMINDHFYEKMERGIQLSRFKIYISRLFSNLEYREGVEDELKEFKKIRKNVGSVITTNYDGLIENIFEFNQLIGNDILLSNPYGSVYKIHGCYNAPSKIIITENDYREFDGKYELIRAQLLSLFIHNPIVFMGYNVGDENIKKILKTIFSYVEPNSEMAEKIKNNFLLIEYESDSDNKVMSEHDIVLEQGLTIRINKIKTDDYSTIYRSISSLQLPVTALDVRKVQSVVKEIFAGGEIKVSITEDLDSLKNSDKILAIGSSKTIQYHYQTAQELLETYFEIIEESNYQILSLIDKFTIQSSQYFPIYGFSSINPDIQCVEKLKSQQNSLVNACLNRIEKSSKRVHRTINDIMEDGNISPTYKSNSILWNTFENNLPIEELESYLRENSSKPDTNYRKLLSVYDLKKFGTPLQE